MAQTAETGREWWRTAHVYQIYPMSFNDSTNKNGTGNIAGITDKLNYLKDLGIDVLWLSPIYASPNRDYGYDISDYRSLDARYGTMKDMEDLLEELKIRDMKLMMDLVVNHTSDLHPWFLESRSSKTNPKRDWYIWRPPRYDEFGNRHPPNNWAAIWEGAAWEWDDVTEEYYLHLYLPQQPDLNWENPEVRKAVHDLMKFWLDKGVAGFRMDVINLISKPAGLPDMHVDTTEGTAFPTICANGPRVLEFLQEMNREVLSKYDTITVGETPWTHDPAVLARYVVPSAQALNMVFTFHHVDIDGDLDQPLKPRSWSLSELKGIIDKWQTHMHAHGGWNSIFTENHDQGRSVTRFGNDSEQWRATSAKMLAIMHISQGGTTYVYQGQELGMRNVPSSWGIEEYKDPATQAYWTSVLSQRRKTDSTASMSDILADIRRKARDNARTPMQWNSEPNAGFSIDKLPWMRVNDDYTEWNVSRQAQDPDSVHAFWKKALQTRKANPVLVYGEFRLINPSDERVFACERKGVDGLTVTVINFTQKMLVFDFNEDKNFKQWVEAGLKVILGNYGAIDEEIAGRVNLEPYEGRLYTPKHRRAVW